MKTWIVLFVLLAVPARAADKALILNDQEQAELFQAIDARVRAQGIQAAGVMLHLLNKLQTAPTVTEQKAPPPAPPPDPKKD